MPDFPPLEQPPAQGLTLVYVNTGSGAAAQIGSAIEEAAVALSWEYSSVTFDPSNPVTGNSAYLAAVQSGADGIISTGLVPAQIEEGLSTAAAAGIPVVLLNGGEDPSHPGDYVQVANGSTNAALWADAMADCVVADAEERGVDVHVAVVSTSGIPVIQPPTEAQLSALQSCSSCSAQLVDVPAADLTSGQAPQHVVSYIQRHPETTYVDVVVGFTEGGMRAALDGAGLQDVQIIGFQPTSAQITEVQDGGSLFWVAVPQAFNAWQSVDAIARMLTGADAELHETAPVPIWVLDSSTIEGRDSETVLDEFPADFRDAFIELWQVA